MNIVAIGGGTGLSTILKGFKKYDNVNLSAIVTTMDDGGSSGRLKKDFGIIAPGDIRNCLVSLSESEEILKKLFQYRFEEGVELSGHSVGNLLLTALTRICGSFEKALEESSKVLNIKGQVIPVTYDKTNLCAEVSGGGILRGEVEISKDGREIKDLYVYPEVNVNLLAIEVINNADIIILSPGSLFTSLLANLVVPEIKESIINSSAKIVYICNLFTQVGETEDFSVEQHIRTISNISEVLVDYCLVNDPATILQGDRTQYYRKEEKQAVDIQDYSFFKCENLKLIKTKLWKKEGGILRHDADKVAEIIMSL